ncbi:MAG: pilin [Candidatus Parcubacteria bacterium]|nr:pilin [Candidatus Parcubacteria bacterium]
MQKLKKYIPLTLAFTPFLAMAATVATLVDKIMSILNIIVPLLIAVAVVIFLFGVVKYITAGGDEEKRKESRNVMIYGIVGLFVMVAVWGLVNVLISTFGLETTVPVVPGLP